ncbi:MAG: nitrate/nitrite transport system permease protein [Moritella dasanensis]|jgi:nitrate/nitrite transport system permease protein
MEMTMLTAKYAKWVDPKQANSKLTAFVAKMTQVIALPLTGILGFLLLWSIAANHIDTSLGKFPGPQAVFTQVGNLYHEHVAEREKALVFYQRQDVRNLQRVAEDPDYIPKIRQYTGKETFFDQIITSLITVLSGFILAALIAVPLGITLGLSRGLSAAINPLIQLFKPVSPLAWLPLVTMVVSAVYVTDDPLVAKSFITSVITVMLCSLWPMVINTTQGVASVEQDLVNVSRVLSLSPLKHVQKIVLPASLPMIFTGMRLSLSVAWMVLIAAEMLAQSPGLGKFVWDEFQNGSSESLSRIMTAVLVIGLIGLLLDKAMLQLQQLLSWDKSTQGK